ncbi:plasmid mobilization protein [Ornithinimicrobium panacihumi]|uniref:plasmid mobilization protein n=1 Tax=Ornithinimicrobium panacihumi TaxID=2008449 RepID=UPI003F8AF843
MSTGRDHGGREAGLLHRSKQREASVLLRMSRDERDELRRKAAEQGLTLQDYMQAVLFNRDPAPLPAGRPKGRRTTRPQVTAQEGSS